MQELFCKGCENQNTQTIPEILAIHPQKKDSQLASLKSSR